MEIYRDHFGKVGKFKSEYGIVLKTGPMSRVFANGPGDQGSILGRVIPKTLKMILDTTLLSTQYYKVRIKVKWSNPGN